VTHESKTQGPGEEDQVSQQKLYLCVWQMQWNEKIV